MTKRFGICVCDDTKTCRYHARRPRRCPRCPFGTMVRSVGKREGMRTKETLGLRPAWFCNACEHCEGA